jgi:hypothetical protein
MDLSNLTVPNIAIFVVPGYFALQAYSSVHSKADKDFSKLLVESIAFSLPLVGIYNPIFDWIYKHWFGGMPQNITVTDVKYFLPLLLIAPLLGFVWARLRDEKWSKQLASKFGIRGPNNDFIETQFKKLKSDALTTITLKNGEIFAGVRAGISSYRKDERQKCYFNFVKWYNKDTGSWDTREGSLIFAIDDVEYIETSHPLPKW